MINQRIIQWQKDRGLYKQKFDTTVEAMNIMEEVIEMMYQIDSNGARRISKTIIKQIKKLGIGCYKETTRKQKLDALCDIQVYATGAIGKLGYDPDIAMYETLQEIESRTGNIVDGKFKKDTSDEARARWYKADYDKADIRVY